MEFSFRIRLNVLVADDLFTFVLVDDLPRNVEPGRLFKVDVSDRFDGDCEFILAVLQASVH